MPFGVRPTGASFRDFGAYPGRSLYIPANPGWARCVCYLIPGEMGFDDGLVRGGHGHGGAAHDGAMRRLNFDIPLQCTFPPATLSPRNRPETCMPRCSTKLV